VGVAVEAFEEQEAAVDMDREHGGEPDFFVYQ
jgi:hypothetical protein